MPNATGPLCDGDNDGVVNGLDQCLNTPDGATVNSIGCRDADGDGFSNDLPSSNLFYDSDDTNKCIPNASTSGCITAAKPDLFINFTFGNTTYAVGDMRYVVINVNEIASVATSGEITLFIPNSAGFTYLFEPTLTSANVITSVSVNNTAWTATQTVSGVILKTSSVIPANGKSRIAIKVTANTVGTEANLSPSVSGGNDGVLSNNIGVLSQSIQN
jgi:hypothetical protein